MAEEEYLPHGHSYCEKKPKDGVWRCWYSSGHLASEVPFIGGLAGGRALYYDETGLVLQSCTLENGLPVGVLRAWHPNGSPWKACEFTEPGIGVCSEWSPDGSPAELDYPVYNDGRRTRRTWDTNGVLRELEATLFGRKDGSFKQWFPDGQPELDETYRNGKLDGVRKRWHPNGLLAEEESWQGGIRHGLRRAWSPEGDLLMDVVYDNGRPGDGPFVTFHENGRVRTRCAYVDRFEDGPWVRYHPDGSLAGEGMKSGGRFIGARRDYYPSGQLEVSKNYSLREGSCEGVQTAFHENGQKAAEGACVQGDRHGDWFYWDEHGVLIAREVYKLGRLKRQKLIVKHAKPKQLPAGYWETCCMRQFND